MGKNRVSFGIVILLLLVMLLLDWYFDIFRKWLPGFDLSEIILLATVIVTYTYAVSTDRMAQHMKQQLHNDVAPVVELDAGMTSSANPSEIRVYFRNIGRGPALNFRCWIEDAQYPNLRNMRYCIARRALGLDKELVFSYIGTGMLNYQLGQGYLRAQYDDVFGQTYESCLMFPANALPELMYGLAKEKIVV